MLWLFVFVAQKYGSVKKHPTPKKGFLTKKES